MRVALSLAFSQALACGVDRNPPLPGGSGGHGGSGDTEVDAGGAADANPALITGRLCPLTDLRQPTLCATDINLADVDVTIDGSTTVTDSAGFFALPRGEEQLVVFRIGERSGIVRPSAVEVDTTDSQLSIPMITEQAWLTLVAGISAFEPDGTATIALYLVDSEGEPVSGAEITPPFGTIVVPYYDGNAPGDWLQGGETGPLGAVLIFGVPGELPEVELSINLERVSLSVRRIPVLPNTLTFFAQEVP